jgi:hypothetical protein
MLQPRAPRKAKPRRIGPSGTLGLRGTCLVLRGASSAQSRNRVRPRPLAPGAWAVAHPAREPIDVTMRLLSTSGPRRQIRRMRPAASGTLEESSPGIPRQQIPRVLPRTIRHNRTLRARSRPGTPLCRNLRHGPISPPSRTGESLHAPECQPKEASRQITFDELQGELPGVPDEASTGLEESLLLTRLGPTPDRQRQGQPAQYIAEIVKDHPMEQPDLIDPTSVAREPGPVGGFLAFLERCPSGACRRAAALVVEGEQRVTAGGLEVPVVG